MYCCADCGTELLLRGSGDIPKPRTKAANSHLTSRNTGCALQKPACHAGAEGENSLESLTRIPWNSRDMVNKEIFLTAPWKIPQAGGRLEETDVPSKEKKQPEPGHFTRQGCCPGGALPTKRLPRKVKNLSFKRDTEVRNLQRVTILIPGLRLFRHMEIIS